MITKEKFLEIYNTLSTTMDMGIKLTTNPVLNEEFMLDYTGQVWKSIELVLSLVIDKEGVDWIYWWFFEKPFVKSDVRATDSYGNPLPTETPEDLWNLINFAQEP